MIKVTYVRVWREGTDSYMTVRLPQPMNFSQACIWVEETMLPGWEVLMGSIEDPDMEWEEL